MLVEGEEINIQKFMKQWQKQVDRMIKEEAEEIIKEKFYDMQESVDNIQETVQGFNNHLEILIKSKLEKLELEKK